MDFWIILDLIMIFNLAFIEEVIKYVFVYVSKGTYLLIPAMLLFPIIESYVYFDVVYDHSLILGATGELACVITILFLIGAKSFHFFTSLFYYNHVYNYKFVIIVAFFHFIYNVIADYTPTLSLYYYLIFPWILTSFLCVCLLLFHKGIKKRERRQSPLL